MGTRNRFRLSLNSVSRLLEIIPPEGATSTMFRDRFPELGGEKVRGIREWADDLGLTHQDGRRGFVTSLGEAFLKTRGSSAETALQEVLYYKLCACRDLEILGFLVNQVLFEASKRFEPIVDVSEMKTRVAAAKLTTTAAPKYIYGEVSTALNTLTNEDGLGKLRMVVPMDRNRYQVNPRRPDWRCAAYMLYDSWPENLSRMRIDEVIGGPNSLGRIFFMTEPQTMVILSKLEQERAIALEVVADLNQVGLNPAMRAQDFLEMLIDG